MKELLLWCETRRKLEINTFAIHLSIKVRDCTNVIKHWTAGWSQVVTWGCSALLWRNSHHPDLKAGCWKLQLREQRIPLSNHDRVCLSHLPCPLLFHNTVVQHVRKDPWHVWKHHVHPFYQHILFARREEKTCCVCTVYTSLRNGQFQLKVIEYSSKKSKEFLEEWKDNTDLDKHFIKAYNTMEAENAASPSPSLSTSFTNDVHWCICWPP